VSNSRNSDNVLKNPAQGDTDQIRMQTRSMIMALALCSPIVLFLSISYFFDSRIAAPVVLNDLVNPNTAPAASLMRLPDIGPSRAAAIVQYRQQFAAEGKPVFQTHVDLEKVKGIGPKTVEKIKPWLYFK
jgi:competence protein ComEA